MKQKSNIKPQQTIYKGPYDPPIFSYTTVQNSFSQYISGLFVVVGEGNVTKIREYIEKNNIVINSSIVDGDGNSLLHIIITKDPKYFPEIKKIHLISFLVDEMNYPTDISNNMGITPLHLAASYQYNQIIRFLIKKNANVMAHDINNKTPLHYAIIGNTHVCKNIRVKDIIKSENLNHEFGDITNVIINTLDSSVLLKYLRHIRNTLDAFDDILLYEYIDLETNYKNDAVKILGRLDMTNEEKKNKINELIHSLQSNIEKILTNKLKTTLTTFDIGTNNSAGWGVDNLHILPYKNINEMRENVHNDVKMKYINNYDDLIKKYNITSNTSDKLQQFVVEMDKNFEAILHISSLIVSGNPPDFYSILFRDSLDSDILIPPEIDISSYNKDKHIQFKKVYNATNPLDLLIDDPEKLGQFKQSKKMTNYKVIPKDHIGYNIPNVTYSIISVFHNFCNNIKKHISILDNNIKCFKKYVEDKNKVIYDLYYKLTVYIVISCLNICQNLSFMSLELSRIKTNDLQRLSREVDEVITKYNDKTVIFNLKKFNNDINTNINAIEKKITELYSNVYNLMVALNKHIDYINSLSGLTFILKYHKTNLKIEKIDELYNLYDKQFEKLQIIPESLNVYISQYNPINNDIKTNKLKIISKFVPQVHKNHYSTYVASPDAYRETSNPAHLGLYVYNNSHMNTTNRKKFMSNNPHDKNVYPLIEFDPNNNPKKATVGILGYEVFDGGFKWKPEYLKYGPMTPDEYKIYKNDFVSPPQQTRYDGSFGLKFYTDNNKPKKYPKEEKAWPVVSTVLDEHFNMIKFSLVQTIISTFEQIMNKKNKDETDKYIFSVLDKIQNIFSIKIPSASSDKNQAKYIMYILISKLADDIIINFIKQCIIRASAVIVTKFYKSEISTDMKDIDLSIIQKPIKSIGAYLHKMNEFILNDFSLTQPWNTNTANKLSFLDTIVEEPPREEGVIILDDDYFSLQLTTEKTCVNTKIDTIKNLLENGAQVNAVDSTGLSVIHYAIKNKLVQVIEELVKEQHNNVIYNGTVTKIISPSNLTPLNYCATLYLKHTNILFNGQSIKDSIHELIDVYYKNLTDRILSSETSANNTLKHLDLCFTRSLLMLNNHFGFMMSNFMRSWNMDDHHNLIKLVEYVAASRQPQHKIPILNEKYPPIFNEIPQNDPNGDVILKKILHNLSNVKTLEIENQENNAMTIILKRKMKSLNLNTPNVSRIKQMITKSISQNSVSESENNKKILKMKQELNNLFQIFNQEYLNSKSRNENLVNTFSINENDIIDTYNKFVTQGHGYHLYNDMWKLHIKNIDNNLGIYVPHFLVLYAQRYIGERILEDANEYSNQLRNLKIVNVFYSKIVMPFIHDYDNLPQEYGVNNYALTIIMKIIAHNIATTTCYNLFIAITQILTQYISTTQPNTNNESHNLLPEKYYSQIMEIIDKILSPQMKKYKTTLSGVLKQTRIFDDILITYPLLLVKCVLHIYEGDDDNDKIYTSVKDILGRIPTKLLLNSFINIDNKSDLITKLNTKIIPYFELVLTNQITYTKALLDNYIKFLNNESKYTNIMILLLEKALKETI